jgi:methylaspartate ammonia-lyase
MVERVVYRGSSSQVFVRLPNSDQIQAFVQNAGDEAEFSSGDAVRVYLPADALRVLADTGTAPLEATGEADSGAVAGTPVTT